MNKLNKVVLSAVLALGASLSACATDYYWNTNVTSGSWSCTNSWCSDKACTKVATSYPKSGDIYAHFLAGTQAEIAMKESESILIKAVDFSASNLKLTFKGARTALLKTNNNSAYGAIGANCRLTFDGLTFYRYGGWTLGAGSSLVATNCDFTVTTSLTTESGAVANFNNSTLLLGGLIMKTGENGASQCYMTDSTVSLNGTYSPEAGTTFELSGTTMSGSGPTIASACFFTVKNKSSVTYTSQLTTGNKATITIDDSTIQCNGYAYFNGVKGPTEGGQGEEHFIIKGANPKFIFKSVYARMTAGNKPGIYFDFEVPVGGYAEPPIQDYNGWSSYWLSGSASGTKAVISILETSPAAKSTEFLTDCPLVYSPYGISRTFATIDDSTMRYLQADRVTPSTSSDNTAKYLFVKLGSGTTPAKPTVEHSTGVSSRAKATVSRRTLTLASDVTALATTGLTRTRYFVGVSQDELEQVGSAIVAAAGEVSFTWTAPVTKLNDTYYMQIILETLDDGGQVIYSESSPVVSATTQDTTVYTWQAVDGEWDGVWSDRAHWVADTGDDRLDYPQSSSCQVEFPAAHAVTITVDQALTIGKLKLNKAGIDATLVNAVEDATQNNMAGILSCDDTSDCSLTFKYLEFKNNDNVFPGNLKKIRFENGKFWTSQYYSGKGTTELYLKNSTSSFSDVMLGGGNVATTETITLDNSQLTVGGNLYSSGNKYGRIAFKGASPKVYLSSKDKSMYSDLDAANAVFAFEIPQGGFTEPPISCISTAKKAFNDTKKLPAFNFVILETSPALMTAGDTYYPLMTWAPGITTGRVNFDGVVSKTDTFLYGDMNVEGYDWQPVATSTLSNPTAIGVKIHGLTSTDIVTVQGNPGDYGTASPAYGQTTGHTAGETATYSVPEPIFTKEGVNYAVSGYVVSNVLADLSTEFAYKGTTSSFEYTHPASATVVTWLWGRSFDLSVNATTGGSVSPTSKTCAEGAIVEITATPETGYGFVKWTGDVGGITDVTKAKINVTMDRARTLTANFGSAVTVSTVDDFISAVESATDGSVITVAKGEYQLTNGVYLSKAIKIVGATGNPEDVVFYGGYNLKTTLSFQMFTLNHAEARLEAITASHGYLCDNYKYGAGIRVSAPGTTTFVYSEDGGLGGTVVNCIVRNCYAKGKFCSGALYVRAADALVDRCVVTNNITYRQTDSGSGNGGFVEVIGGGVVRNTLIADNSDPNDQGIASVYVGKNSSLINCTVANNSITGNKAVGGVQTQDATAKVVNCVIAGNTTKAATPEWASWSGNAASFVNCALDAYAPNESCYAGARLGLKSLAGKDYHPVIGSACIDFGTEAAYGNDDLDGAKRESGDHVDAGCYEYDYNQFAVGFTADVLSGFAPLQVTFTPAISGVQAGDEMVIKWDFNNDGTVDLTTTTFDSVTNTYGPGHHSVSLKVENARTAKTASLTNIDMISAGAKTLYVKLGNEKAAAYPYDSESNAAADVQTAIDASLEGAEVRIFDGDYQLSTSITLEKEITITSESGNKDAVILRGGRQKLYSPKFHVLKMNAGTGALVHSLTLADGITSDQDNAGCVYLHTRGGVISNCVVTGGAACYKTGKAGGIYASGANALVTHCVLSNNFARGGYSDGASAQGAAIALYSGARCEHTLITQNVMGQPNGSLYGIGPSQNTVHVGADSYLRFCTIVSNAAYCVAGVNVESAKSHVEYCVIAGNHSMHADETTYNGTANGGKDNATDDQVNRWNVWGTVAGFGQVKSGAAATATNRDDYVCTQERANATAAVAAAFVGCVGDTVKINDSALQAPVKTLFRSWENGKLVSRRKSPAVDVLDPAAFALPATDVYGNPRVQGGKLDLGATETADVGMVLIVR